MELKQGINRAKQLANLKGKKDTEFYECVVNWLEELNEYKKHSNDDKIYHGMSDTRIYHIWKMMKSRCNNANSQNYKHYGGRGISVCKEWDGSNGFWSFYNWSIQNGYTDELSIDRIDNDGNYCPENCRWTTLSEQAKNKRPRKNRLTLTYKGKTMSVNEWAEHLGIDRHVIYQRIKKGWTIEEIVETPLNVSHSNRGQGRKKQ